MIFELLVVLDGTGSVYDDIGWYLLVLPGIRWYRVSKGLVCLYIYWKKWRFGRVLPMPDTQTQRQQNIELLSLSTVLAESRNI